MDISRNNHMIAVTLSRRNLEQLIKALNEKGSDCGLVRVCENGDTVYVFAQEDKDHYKGREPGPGIRFLDLDGYKVPCSKCGDMFVPTDTHWTTCSKCRPLDNSSAHR